MGILNRVTRATETSICPSWRAALEDRRHGKRFHISPDNTASALLVTLARVVSEGT